MQECNSYVMYIMNSLTSQKMLTALFRVSNDLCKQLLFQKGNFLKPLRHFKLKKNALA